MKSKARQLREELDAVASKHTRTKARYQQTADNVEKCWQKVSAGKSDSLLTVNQKTYMKVWNLMGWVQNLSVFTHVSHLWQNNERLAVLEAELSYQELIYKEAQKKHLEVKESFDRQVKELYEVRPLTNKPY